MYVTFSGLEAGTENGGNKICNGPRGCGLGQDLRAALQQEGASAALEAAAGRAQDAEGALRGGRAFLLQSRPQILP